MFKYHSYITAHSNGSIFTLLSLSQEPSESPNTPLGQCFRYWESLPCDTSKAERRKHGDAPPEGHWRRPAGLAASVGSRRLTSARHLSGVAGQC